MVPTLLTGDQLDRQQVRLWLQQLFLADRPDAGFLRPAVRQGAGARRRRRLPPAARSLDDLREAPDRPARRPHPDEGRTALHQRRPGAAPPVGPFAGDAGGRDTPTCYVETLPGGREHEIIEMSDADRYDDTPVFVVPPRHYFMMGDNRDNSARQPHRRRRRRRRLRAGRQPGRPRRPGAAVARSGGRLVRRRRNGRTPSGRGGCSAASTKIKHDQGLAFGTGDRGPLRAVAGAPHRGDARASGARRSATSPRARGASSASISPSPACA